jgi:hypothetical protein
LRKVSYLLKFNIQRLIFWDKVFTVLYNYTAQGKENPSRVGTSILLLLKYL